MTLDVSKMSEDDIISVLNEEHGFTPKQLNNKSREELIELLEQYHDDEDEEGEIDLDQFEPVPEEQGEVSEPVGDVEPMNPTNPGWTEYVISHMEPDEMVGKSPTTDGLRRVCERLYGDIESHHTEILDAPNVGNERRATVKVGLSIRLQNGDNIYVEGAADVYWGNTDKPFRNHPIATAETRAEGRALRRAMRLTKLLVAEENSPVVDHDYDSDGEISGTLSQTQENFVIHMCSKLNLNARLLIKRITGEAVNSLRDVKANKFDKIQTQLVEYQRGEAEVPTELQGFDENWR